MHALSRPTAPRGRSAGILALLAAATVVLAACSSGSSGSTTTSTTKPASTTLRVLVTNDDGVGAPGINAAVQALRSLPHTQVTVVAPLTNQSGTGSKTTAGALTVTNATTSSGYPAKAVAGYPVDTVIWAIDDHGIDFRPDVVVSGINFGENVGPLADGSGTVGAARAALVRDIPALAVSQGIDNGAGPDFSQGAHQLTRWITAHRAALVHHPANKLLPEGNLNVPTCANGRIRGPVHVPQAESLTGINIGTVDCTSTMTDPATDAEGFVEGFAVISPLGDAS
jgi:5'-nucleotidase